MIRGLGAGASVPPRVAVPLRVAEMCATRPASMVACGPPRDFGCGPWQLFAWRWVSSLPCVYLDGLVASRIRVASVRRRSWNPGFAFGPSRYSGFAFWPFGAEKRLWMDRGRTPLLWMARGRTLLSAKATGWTKPEPGIRRRPLNGRSPNPEFGDDLWMDETRTRNLAAISKQGRSVRSGPLQRELGACNLQTSKPEPVGPRRSPQTDESRTRNPASGFRRARAQCAPGRF